MYVNENQSTESTDSGAKSFESHVNFVLYASK